MNSVVQRARINRKGVRRGSGGEGGGGKGGSAEQPHFPRLITEKRFTRVCRAGNSKNADNPSGTNRTERSPSVAKMFSGVCKRVKYPAYH